MKPSLRHCLLLSLVAFVMPTLFTACSDEKSTNPDPGPDPDTSDPAIAYVWEVDGNREIFVMDADTTHKTRLTNNDSLDYRPVWSPDGTWIAFVSSRTGGQTDIYYMQPDGSTQNRLTFDFADDDIPVWSPDGNKLLFETNRDGNTEIYVIDMNTSVKANLTNNAAYDGQACWSPDGIRIAFISDRDGIAEVYVMNFDGSDQTRMTPYNAGAKGYPDWSPDGSKILYSDAGADATVIRWVDDDGTMTQKVTPAGSSDRELHAEWSPSGEKIVYFAIYYHFVEGNSGTIRICNADGTGLTDCWDLGSDAEPLEPYWIPDGTRIYFSRFDRIYAFDVDGASHEILAGPTSVDPMPNWRPQ